LGWELLGTLRLLARAILLEKSRTDLLDRVGEDIIWNLQYTSRSDKNGKLRENHCQKDRYKNSFFPTQLAIT
jgi:hypothetical protein